MKIWQNRFDTKDNDLLDEFNNSIDFDYILYKYDIKGSIAHVKMLAKQKIIEQKEKDIIIDGLKNIKKEIDNEEFDFKKKDEDIHMAIERRLIEIKGKVGKKLHTARSRNDQIALDMKLYCKDKINSIEKNLINLLSVLNELSKDNIDDFMPGYTHLQGAQIIRTGFYFQSYFQKFKRDLERLNDLKKRVDVLPLGTGALAGVNYETDRFYLAEILGFENVSQNALDTVSNRDYILELLNDISLIALHLSRFCEEIIIFASQEYNFFKLDDAYCTGSSIMPQKKNPDVAELIRGKSGKMFSNYFGLLTTLKGLPLAYNKDMQEDKKYLFSSCEDILKALKIFSNMVKTMKLNKEKMENACKKGYLQATDIADYLVKKGLEFRTAYQIVGKIVKDLEEKNLTFESMSILEYKGYSKYFDKDIHKVLELNYSVEMKKSFGSTSKESVLKMIKNSKDFLKDYKKNIDICINIS